MLRLIIIDANQISTIIINYIESSQNSILNYSI